MSRSVFLFFSFFRETNVSVSVNYETNVEIRLIFFLVFCETDVEICFLISFLFFAMQMSRSVPVVFHFIFGG